LAQQVIACILGYVASKADDYDHEALDKRAVWSFTVNYKSEK